MIYFLKLKIPDFIFAFQRRWTIDLEFWFGGFFFSSRFKNPLAGMDFIVFFY